eukprot:Blabericola_migrator_1__3304@NODE_1974_length_3482_cov_11_377745_g1257_i0_p3_GENE_NODE_1974_length_3482_cov_11_377745_g1257_i0NODE_1974_length_3482_cov_11_377745_g1257_i0_p3_ORF_typecomplete_len124_score4_70_NODE_1974_length_3482_cov_11_377745_g1257_i06551026
MKIAKPCSPPTIDSTDLHTQQSWNPSAKRLITPSFTTTPASSQSVRVSGVKFCILGSCDNGTSSCLAKLTAQSKALCGPAFDPLVTGVPMLDTVLMDAKTFLSMMMTSGWPSMYISDSLISIG